MAAKDYQHLALVLHLALLASMAWNKAVGGLYWKELVSGVHSWVELVSEPVLRAAEEAEPFQVLLAVERLAAKVSFPLKMFCLCTSSHWLFQAAISELTVVLAISKIRHPEL